MLRGSPLRRLPPGVRSLSRLTLVGVRRLPALPEGLAVAGDVHLETCSHLRRLAPGLRVGGRLEIVNCPRLCRLGDALEVAGDLVVRGCVRLEELPAGRVGGDLVLAGFNRLGALPEHLEVGGRISIRRGIHSLPERMKVPSDLVVTDCDQLEALPDHLEVGGSLVVHRCPRLRRLPSVLRAEGAVVFHECRGVRRIPADWKIGTYLDLRGCNRLTRLPDGLRVPGWMNLARCTRLERLPRRLSVGPVRRGWLAAAGRAATSRLRSLPTWRRAALLLGPMFINQPRPGTLDLTQCRRLTELPGDLEVTRVEVAGAGLTAVPDGVRLTWTGVEVPQVVVVAPHRLEPRQVFSERNAEVRRIMFERADAAVLLAGGDVDVVHQDRDAGGRRRLLRLHLDQGDLQFLECRCPSTGRVYHLRVPPSVGDCRRAAAWIAGFDNVADYAPLYET